MKWFKKAGGWNVTDDARTYQATLLSALGMENMSEVKDNMKSYEFELATKADSSGKKSAGP